VKYVRGLSFAVCLVEQHHIDPIFHQPIPFHRSDTFIWSTHRNHWAWISAKIIIQSYKTSMELLGTRFKILS